MACCFGHFVNRFVQSSRRASPGWGWINSQSYQQRDPMLLRFKVRLGDDPAQIQCEVKLPGRRTGRISDLKFEI